MAAPLRAEPGLRAASLRATTLRTAWWLAAAAVLCQIGYPLLEGTARDRLTVLTVLVGFGAVAAHATARLGGRAATTVMGTVLAVAAAAEILGVRTGLPFGDYVYGDGLGPSAAGVPLVVPLAWAMTAYPALIVARRLTRRHGPAVTALVAGWALASWDLFLDPQMVEAGHWTWADPTPALPGSPGVPVTNYVGWLLVSIALMAALDRLTPPTGAASTQTLLPGLIYLWTYAAQVLGNLAFFDRPAVAAIGGLAMGAVALPYARALRNDLA